ncbi:MAG: hypothetical protein D6739_08730 [Nitrospirae bacterium]|nr:MAG: hypothetical protein D6739_08730 [Nitrospirota bacterium]
MKLSARERLLVAVAVVLVVVLGAGNFAVAPLLSRLHLMERKVAQKREELQEFAALERRYLELAARAKGFEQRVTHHAPGFSLFVELEGIAKRVGVRDRIGSFKPQDHTAGDYREQTVEVDLKGLTLEELGRFLSGIESSREALYVKRIEISRQVGGQGPPRLRARLVVGALLERKA